MTHPRNYLRSKDREAREREMSEGEVRVCLEALRDVEALRDMEVREGHRGSGVHGR
jgi:hypothetical protein